MTLAAFATVVLSTANMFSLDAVAGPPAWKLEIGLLELTREMVELATSIQKDTEHLDKVIVANADKRPNARDLKTLRNLADRQKRLVKKATQAIDLLEANSVAVSFTEVYRQVRDDMMAVQRRLAQDDTGSDTRFIQQDTLETLAEIIQSFRKR